MSILGELIGVGLLAERNGLGLNADEAYAVGERIAAHLPVRHFVSDAFAAGVRRAATEMDAWGGDCAASGVADLLRKLADDVAAGHVAVDDA